MGVKPTTKKQVEKILMRKITPTRTGGRLINLAGILPKDWEYADVYLTKASRNTILVEFDLVRLVTDHVRNTERLSRTTEKPEPAI